MDTVIKLVFSKTLTTKVNMKMKKIRLKQITKIQKILLIIGRRKFTIRFKADKHDYNNVMYVLSICTIINKCQSILDKNRREQNVN